MVSIIPVNPLLSAPAANLFYEHNKGKWRSLQRIIKILTCIRKQNRVKSLPFVCGDRPFKAAGRRSGFKYIISHPVFFVNTKNPHGKLYQLYKKRESISAPSPSITLYFYCVTGRLSIFFARYFRSAEASPLFTSPSVAHSAFASCCSFS